jgi:hypothetical protein
MSRRSKEIEELLDQVARLPGWRVDNTSKGWRIYPPAGTPMSAPHGPHNTWRTLKNLRAKLRRAGADI